MSLFLSFVQFFIVFFIFVKFKKWQFERVTSGKIAKTNPIFFVFARISKIDLRKEKSEDRGGGTADNEAS